MVLYYLRSPLRTGGDEYNLAIQLGINRSVVEILFAGMFTICMALGLRVLETWRSRLKWLGTILLGSIPTGLLLMAADNLVRAQVVADNPFFQPVIGFSFPVLLLNGLALIGLWIWVRFQEGPQP